MKSPVSITVDEVTDGDTVVSYSMAVRLFGWCIFRRQYTNEVINETPPKSVGFTVYDDLRQEVIDDDDLEE